MNPFQGLTQYADLVKSNVDKLGQGGLFGGLVGQAGQGEGGNPLLGGLVGQGLSALFGGERSRMAGDGVGLTAREVSSMVDGDRDTRRQFLIEILGPERTKPLRQRYEEDMDRRMFFSPSSDTFG